LPADTDEIMEEASPLASLKNGFISAVSAVKENLANRFRSASTSPPAAPASPPTADKPAPKRTKVAAAAPAAATKASA
jgi:hypothetical protein